MFVRGFDMCKIFMFLWLIGVVWVIIVFFIVVFLVESGWFGKRFCEFDCLVVEEWYFNNLFFFIRGKGGIIL